MEHTKTNVGEPLDVSIQALIECDYHGIIGVEAATTYWGLSTFNPRFSIVLVDDPEAGPDGILIDTAISWFFAPDVNKVNIVRLSEHLSVTDPEQTVCDMIRYNRHEFHLFETLLSAYSGSVDTERLERLAQEYKILGKLHDLLQEAISIEEEG